MKPSFLWNMYIILWHFLIWSWIYFRNNCAPLKSYWRENREIQQTNSILILFHDRFESQHQHNTEQGEAVRQPLSASAPDDSIIHQPCWQKPLVHNTQTKATRGSPANYQSVLSPVLRAEWERGQIITTLDIGEDWPFMTLLTGPSQIIIVVFYCLTPSIPCSLQTFCRSTSGCSYLKVSPCTFMNHDQFEILWGTWNCPDVFSPPFLSPSSSDIPVRAW